MDSLRANGISAVACMVKNCRSQVAACIADPECKAGLDCLQACSPTDQVRIPCGHRDMLRGVFQRESGQQRLERTMHACPLGLGQSLLLARHWQELMVRRGALRP